MAWPAAMLGRRSLRAGCGKSSRPGWVLASTTSSCHGRCLPLPRLVATAHLPASHTLHLAPAAGAAHHTRQALLMFGGIVQSLVLQPVWSSHAAAIQADASLQQAFADVLLPRSLKALLPKLGALSQQGNAASFYSILVLIRKRTEMLQADCLEPALQRRMQQGGSLAACMGAAFSMLQLLPAQCSPAPEQLQLACARTASLELAGHLARLATGQDLSIPIDRVTHAAQTRQEWQQVAVLVLQALPQLTSAFKAAANDSAAVAADQEAWALALATWCADYGVVLQAALDLGSAAMPAEAATTCLQAAVAALRLQPLLVQIAPALRRHRSLESLAVRLSLQLARTVDLALLMLGTPQQVRAAAAACATQASGAAAAGDTAVTPSQAVAATHLHSQAGGDGTHYLAQGGSFLIGAPLWGMFLSNAHGMFAAAAELCGLPPLG